MINFIRSFNLFMWGGIGRSYQCRSDLPVRMKDWRITVAWPIKRNKYYQNLFLSVNKHWINGSMKTNGGRSQVRTDDLQVNSLLLYQLSYAPNYTLLIILSRPKGLQLITPLEVYFRFICKAHSNDKATYFQTRYLVHRILLKLVVV